jgi:outer membrane protein OmpA-like peptidoglycan-associated protein
VSEAQSAQGDTDAESTDTETIAPDQDHDTQLRRVREGFDLAPDHEYTLVVEPWEVLGCAAVEGLTFRFGNSFVHPRAADSLPMVGKLVQERGEEGKLVAFGHTDKVGSDAANKALSERRAKAVVALIQRDPGVWVSIDDEESWGTDVVQTCLLHLDYPPGPVDGVNGEKTKAAVKAFQADQGQDEDGIAGPLTRKALYTEYQKRFETEIPADAFMDPAFLAVGEKHPVVETDDACEANRRVTFFLFKAKRLPPLPGCHDDQGEWYAKIAKECECGDPQITPTPVRATTPDDPAGPGPPVVEEVELAIRSAKNGPPPAQIDGSVQLRAIPEPPVEGTYRWSSSHPGAQIQAEGPSATVSLESGSGADADDVPVTVELETGAGTYCSEEHVLQIKPAQRLISLEVSLLNESGAPFPDDLELTLSGADSKKTASASQRQGEGESELQRYSFYEVSEGESYSLQASGGGKEQELFAGKALTDGDGGGKQALFARWSPDGTKTSQASLGASG